MELNYANHCKWLRIGFVDSWAYNRAGSEYFVVLLHVLCIVVTIKSGED